MSKPLCLLVASVALFLQPQPCLGLPFQPPGLLPGQSYHWMFVTFGTRDAESTNIADYNAFVFAEAALNPSLTGTNQGILWYAIASTETIDAADNALVQGPVFLLNGSAFATDADDMWAPPNGNNFLGTHAVRPNISQYGVERPLGSNPWVWTGTNIEGIAQSNGLGQLGDSWVGNYTSPLGTWISAIHTSGLYRLTQYRLPGGASRLAALLLPQIRSSILGRRALPSGRRAPEFGTDSADTGH